MVIRWIVIVENSYHPITEMWITKFIAWVTQRWEKDETKRAKKILEIRIISAYTNKQITRRELEPKRAKESVNIKNYLTKGCTD